MLRLEYNKPWFKEGKFTTDAKYYTSEAFSFIFKNAQHVEHTIDDRGINEINPINNIVDMLTHKHFDWHYILSEIIRYLPDNNCPTADREQEVAAAVQPRMQNIRNRMYTICTPNKNKYIFNKSIYTLNNAKLVVVGVNEGGYLDFDRCYHERISDTKCRVYNDAGNLSIGIEMILYINNKEIHNTRGSFLHNLHNFRHNNLSRYISYYTGNRRNISKFYKEKIERAMMEATYASHITESVIVYNYNKQDVINFLRSRKLQRFVERQVNMWGMSWRGVSISKIFMKKFKKTCASLIKVVEDY